MLHWQPLPRQSIVFERLARGPQAQGRRRAAPPSADTTRRSVQRRLIIRYRGHDRDPAHRGNAPATPRRYGIIAHPRSTGRVRWFRAIAPCRLYLLPCSACRQFTNHEQCAGSKCLDLYQVKNGACGRLADTAEDRPLRATTARTNARPLDRPSPDFHPSLEGRGRGWVGRLA